MSRLLRPSLLAMLVCLAALAAAWPAWAGEFRVGVLAYRGKAQALQRWQGHADYLNRQLAPHRFVVVPLSYDEINQAVARRTISFLATNSGQYTELEMSGAVSPLATRLMAGPKGVLDRFGGVLITRADRTDINGYGDLPGKRLLIPEHASLGGWQVHLREAVDAGVDPGSLQVIETQNHEAVVRKVLAGEADAGFVRSDLLESMAAAGKLDLAALRAVAARSTPGYPYLHSTRLYPEWPFARVEGAPDEVSRQVAIALLSMPADSPAAVSAGQHGWTTPRNYQEIETLLRVAQLGPFAHRPISLREVLVRYELPIAALLALIIAALAAAVVVIRRSNAALRDEAARHRATGLRLAEREARFRSLFEENVLGIVYQEPGGRILSANSAAERILGVSVQTMQQRDSSAPEWQSIYPDGSPMPAEAHPTMRALAAGRVLSSQRMGIHNPRLGSPRWLNVSAVPQFRPGESRPFQVFAVFEDITEQVNIETRLRLLATVFADTREGIIIADRERRIIEINEAAARITGFRREELIGQPANRTHAPGQPGSLYREIRESLTNSGHWRGEMSGMRHDGSTYPVHVSASVVRDSAEQITHTVGIFSDITALKDTQAKLEFQANFDALTGLPNRVLLLDRMHHAIATTDRAGDMMAVCYLDLDGFKPVNDTWGHAIGDSLLVAVAERLQKLVRASDTVSRLGGDEFVIILSNVANPGEATFMLKRLCGSLGMPYQLGEVEVSVSASIGATLYPDDIGEPGILIRHADRAMYEAKKSGRNRYHLYDAEHEKVDESRGEARRGIEQAIARNEFRLYYQPKVDMRAGKVIGAEALIRWQHPERGLLSPDEFLPAVEYLDLNVEMGRWVLDRAFAHAQAWQAQGLRLVININLAADHLQHPELIDDLKALLQRYPRVRPEQIELEIVETAALGNLAEVSIRLRECQALGFKFAVDDFGTGYSSLSYLKSLPVDTLKIDQVFVRDMLEDPEDLAIVEGVIAMAAAFRRSVIAEGMETTAHGRLLLGLGCDLAQGYGIARPMPADALAAWIAGWQCPAEWLEPAVGRWSREDLPLLTLEIDHKRWMRNLLRHLDSPCADPAQPAEDPRRCRVGQWIKNDGRRYATSASFRPLVEFHHQTHHIAHDLVARKQQGEEITQAQRAALHAASQSLCGELQQLRDDVEAINRAREVDIAA